LATPSFEPTRTQWRGRRSSNPPIAQLNEGDWWYRNDLGIFCFWDGSSINCIGGMGGKIAEGSTTTVYATGGDKEILVTVAGLSVINYVLRVRFTTDPTVDSGNPVNEVVTGNVVGFTLVGLGAGTTLTTTVTATGW